MDLLETLGDFTSKENWDTFFTIRGADDAFEWYADWPSLRGPLLAEIPAGDARILVPGCGSSRLSEHVYDAGFCDVTNVDFSKVVVAAMLRRNVRDRPKMKWRVMDITDIQFAGESFDVVIDKGALDALMEPKLGPRLGSKYLKEVKRVLKSRGIFLCITLAEGHVLGLLFSEFRFGWKTSVLAIPQNASKKQSLQTFIMVITKYDFGVLDQINTLFDHSSKNLSAEQGLPLILAIKNENETRTHLSSGADVLYSLEDLHLGAKGDLKELHPGLRCQTLLGEKEDSCFTYRAVLLDAKQYSDTFSYQCGVFIVPKTRTHEWLFSSEEGQWLVVDSSKAARLIMVFLDSRHMHANMDDIQKDLSPLVKHLVPEKCDDISSIPFLTAGDGIKQRNIVKQVTSAVTGPIIIEDVIYESNNDHLEPIGSTAFRRLTFERSPGLVQSEALLFENNHSEGGPGERERKRNNVRSKPVKKKSQGKNISQSRSNWKVDHSYLASSYHSGILAGFMLISSSLRSVVPSGTRVKTIIVGLGAGLLPMCLHRCMHFLDVEVVELDPVVLDVARDCFAFVEDEQLKVHIADGIKFIQERSLVSSETTITYKEPEPEPKCMQPPTKDGADSLFNWKQNSAMKIVIIDADSSDTRSGLACPPAEFLEESFLSSVKKFLAGGGIFVINLVSRSTETRAMVVSKLKTVFTHLFYLELEEDVNDVVFALPSEACIDLDRLPEKTEELLDLLMSTEPQMRENIKETAKKIKYLK